MAFQESADRESTEVVADLGKAKVEAIAAALGDSATATAVSSFGSPNASGGAKDVTFVDEVAMSGFNGSSFGKVTSFAYSTYSANAGTSASDLMSSGKGKRGRSNSLHIENNTSVSSFGGAKGLQKSATPLVEPGYLEKRKARNAGAARKEDMIMGVNNVSMSLTASVPKGADLTQQAMINLGVPVHLINELNSIERAKKDPSGARLAKGARDGHAFAEDYMNANPNNNNTQQAVKMTNGMH